MGTATAKPMSMTQASVDHGPISRAARAEPRSVEAHRTAVASPPTIAITRAVCGTQGRTAALGPRSSERGCAVGQGREPLLPCAFVLDTYPCRVPTSQTLF